MSTGIKPAPVKSSRPGRAKLTAYESDQVSQIAEWKSRPPNPLTELIRKITLPGGKLIQRILPDAMVGAVIAKSYQLAVRLAGEDDINTRAEVKDVREMLKKSLEDCDRLAFETGVFSQVFATAEGAATGAGGVLTTLVDIPLLLILALRTILKIGHCYGYPLDHHKDESFVLGVLIAATSGTLPSKRYRLDQLHSLEEMIIRESQEEILADEVLSLLFQLEIFASVPGMGAISGGVLNLAFMRRVDNTARRVFQERWLRANSKVQSITPAPAHPRNLAEGWGGTAVRAAHWGCYCAGFGVALPAYFLASLVQPMDNSLIRGIKAGADDARRGVDLVLSSVNGETAARSRSPSRRPAAALGRS
jgi:EcsC protein family